MVYFDGVAHRAFQAATGRRATRPLASERSVMHSDIRPTSDSSGRRLVIHDGESLSALAVAAGLDPATVWEHPGNAVLREARPVPLHLCAGDEVFVPGCRPREVPAQADARHVFKRRGIPARYRAQIFGFGGKVRAGEPYSLSIDGRLQQGRTDDEGVIDVFLPPGAQQGELHMDKDGWTLAIRFARMAPQDTVAGAQMRLSNLGFFDGDADGVIDESSRQALVRFQVAASLPVTCEFDTATLAEIARYHDHRSGDIPNREAPGGR